MKAHLIDTHLLVQRSRSSANVKVKYQGHVSQKMGVSGALLFHKHILFLMKSRTTLKVGHVGSKTRSLCQILENPCARSRGHMFLSDYHETLSECLS